MEIQIYNENSIATLSPNDMMIVEALKSDLVNNVSDKELKQELINLVAAAFLTAGFKAPETSFELNIILDEIISELRRIKTNIRIKEISIAFKNGVHKKYGEYMGLSAVSFCQFIKAYLQEQARSEALKLQNTPKETYKPSDDEIYQISVSNCLAAFKELKAKGTVGRFGVVVYDFLIKHNIFQLDVEEKKQYWQDAKQDFKAYLENEIASSMDKSSISRLKNDLLFIVSTLEVNAENANEQVKYPETTKQKLITISKRLAVDDYFRGLELEDLTIEEVLNGK